jgi:hypothetical protein
MIQWLLKQGDLSGTVGLEIRVGKRLHKTNKQTLNLFELLQKLFWSIFSL